MKAGHSPVLIFFSYMPNKKKVSISLKKLCAIAIYDLPEMSEKLLFVSMKNLEKTQMLSP